MAYTYKIPLYSEVDGKTRILKIDAESKPEAISMVKSHVGESIIDHKIKQGGRVTRKPLSKDAMSDFAFDFASLLEGKMSPGDAVACIAETCEDKNVRGLAVRTARKIKIGKSVAQAFEEEKDIIGETAVGLIHQGDISKDLEGSLKTLSEILHREVKQKAKVSAALFAPIITLFILSGVLNMTMLLLIPKVRDEIGPRFEVNIVSQTLFKVATLWQNVWWIFLLAAIAAAITMWRSTKIKDAAYMILMRHWALARAAFLANKFADFAYIFGRLLERKLPQEEALKSAALRFGNSQFAKQLVISAEQVRQGRPLYEVLSKETTLDAKTLAQTKIGMETGRLDQQLVTYGLNAYERASRSLDRFERITSLLALFVGGFFIIVALFAAYAPIVEYTLYLMDTSR
jgi:type II secretory pathway component PulF